MIRMVFDQDGLSHGGALPSSLWVGADIEVDRGASWQTRWRAGGGAAAGTMLGALRALLVLFAFQLPLSSGQVDCENDFEEIIWKFIQTTL